jgi:hypothetical protein
LLENSTGDRVVCNETSNNAKSESDDRKDDSVDYFGSNPDPKSAIYHFSGNGDTFPEALDKQGFAFGAYQSIPKSDSSSYYTPHIRYLNPAIAVFRTRSLGTSGRVW